jgi:hypothetical protein
VRSIYVRRVDPTAKYIKIKNQYVRLESATRPDKISWGWAGSVTVALFAMAGWVLWNKVVMGG